MRESVKHGCDKRGGYKHTAHSGTKKAYQGDVNPTVSVLWKIANGYKVSFTSLVERKNETISVVRQTDVEPLKEDGGRYLNYPVFPFNEKTLFETYRIVIEQSGTLSAEPHLNGSEEYIFAGQVEITVADESFQLSKGDSIRFYANVPHSYRNMGIESAELSMLIYYNR